MLGEIRKEDRVTKPAILLAALAVAAAPALAQSTATASPKTARKEAATTVSAVVDSIDYTTREMTLDTPKEGKVTVVVDPEVQRLNEIKKGDTVSVTYYVGLLAEVRPPTDAERTSPYQENVGGATGGEKPAAGVARQIKAVTTVVAVDKANKTITFKGPRGRTETIKVEDPANLEKAKAGDTVVFTYTEAVAVAVKAAPKPK
jgi:hypothetical protein